MRTAPQQSRNRLQKLRKAATALPLVLAMVAAGATVPPPAAATGRPDKIDKRVHDQASKAEQVTVWAILRDKADLRPAHQIQDRTSRGAFVVDRLKRTADQSQQGIRTHLTKRGVRHQAYWITNAIRITADLTLIKEISADPNVERILPDHTYRIPEPSPAPPDKTKPAVHTVEWNIDRIRAPQVWSTFGTRGEGIVVANIDTGVQFDHPALVAQYRGNRGAGTFDHNYNWYDPANVCTSPSLTPCDNVGHGTHTMGTMVGDDGTPGPNQIGVAPRARWIAAKGCESNSCSTQALLAAGQWILAPTDLTGRNPRPELRPHIVNNSWGGGGNDPFYQSVVNAWVSSGIFPAFSNGNSGPDCNTSTSPGDYANSYSSGAFDAQNLIADFSSRGSAGGETKPNIAAPGVSIRSSIPTDSYATFSGTSMASPHVAATVALMWSAAPALAGDITATRTLLDDTAIDVSDLSCGGTADDNNVWGEGRLDAFAAVQAAPRGGGTLQGRVTNSGTGQPISGAVIRAVGPVDRIATTDATGRYRLPLPAGTFDITATAFGFRAQTAADVTIRTGETTTRDFALQTAPTRTVSGNVRDPGGAPVPNATVTLLGTPIPPATTDAAGAYHFPNVPEGEYDVRAEAGNCTLPQTAHLVVNGNETLNFVLPPRTDDFGHRCRPVTPGYIEAGTVLPLSGDDASAPVTLPFPVTFYGQTYRTAHVSTNGFLNFLGPDTTYSNTAIPAPATPNAAIYPFWDDLHVDPLASVRTQTSGTAPDRTFAIEWRNVTFYADSSRRIDVEVVLHEDGRIRFEYRNIADDDRERGNSATIGIENSNGTDALQYSYHAAAVGSPTFALLFTPPPSGFVQGTVTDHNDRRPIAAAAIRALRGGVVIRSTTTGSDGRYRLALPLGSYTIEARVTNYATATTNVVIDEQGETLTRDFALRTARGVVTPTSLEYVMPVGQSRTRTLTLRNTGSLPLQWRLTDPVPWLYGLPPTSGTLAPGASRTIQVVVNAAGLTAGRYDTTILISTNSGRQADLRIPVRLVASAYFVGVNAGGRGFQDASGDYWWADQAYRQGSWGYTNPRSTTARTTGPISGTTDDLLYQDLRSNPIEYRFDRLPAGVYEIDLRFAEIATRAPNTRLADVIAEGTTLLPAHDIVSEVGVLAADQHVFYVRVTDGQLNLRFVERARFSVPIVNAIQVIHRPDR